MTERLDALADRVADRVCERVAEMLDERDVEPPPLLDAAQAARYLSLSRATVYERAEELGAIYIGDGPRPRLRFDPKVLAEVEKPEISPSNGRRRSRPRSDPADLLPVRGEVGQ